MGPKLHHFILVHSGNSKLFSPAKEHKPLPTQNSLSIPITAGAPGSSDMWKQSLREGSDFTVDCWIRVLPFIFSAGSTITFGWRAVDWWVEVCVCACVHVCLHSHLSRKHDPQMQHYPPAYSKCTLQNGNSKTLSMKAQDCNLTATNWLRISGGFIPSGSAWSPVFHCSNCQSCGGTGVHIWMGDLFLLLTLHVSPPNASHFWSRSWANPYPTPSVRPTASLLSVFQYFHPSYISYCLPHHAVPQVASRDMITNFSQQRGWCIFFFFVIMDI